MSFRGFAAVAIVPRAVFRHDAIHPGVAGRDGGVTAGAYLASRSEGQQEPALHPGQVGQVNRHSDAVELAELAGQ